MYSEVFKNKNFLKIWVAQLTSQLAVNFLNFALIIRVYDLSAQTRYANVAVSLLILAFGIPSVIFAVLAGSYVDHWDRKKVLVITNIARAVLVLGFLIIGTNLFLVYLLVFAISVFSQFFTPAEGAALPKIVSKKSFLSANSLFLFTMYASFVLGYSLAGPIVLAFGPSSVYYVTAVAFIIASALCATLPSLRAEKSVKKISEINKEVFSTIRNSLNQIFTNPRLILPIINLTIGQAMLGILAVLAPAIAMILFGQSLASVSTMLILPAAIGMLFGAITVGQLFKHISKTKVIDAGIMLASTMLILLSIVPVLHKLSFFGLIVTAVAFVLGFANGLVGVSAQTLLQLNSTDEARGKIFGTLNMAMNIAAIVPVLLAGITADLINPLYALTGAGVLISIYGVFQHKAFSRLQLKST